MRGWKAVCQFWMTCPQGFQGDVRHTGGSFALRHGDQGRAQHALGDRVALCSTLTTVLGSWAGTMLMAWCWWGRRPAGAGWIATTLLRSRGPTSWRSVASAPSRNCSTVASLMARAGVQAVRSRAAGFRKAPMPNLRALATSSSAAAAGVFGLGLGAQWAPAAASTSSFSRWRGQRRHSGGMSATCRHGVVT